MAALVVWSTYICLLGMIMEVTKVSYAGSYVRVFLLPDSVEPFEDQKLLNGYFVENSEDPDEIPPTAAFHQGLHCLLRQNRSSEKEKEKIFGKL